MEIGPEPQGRTRPFAKQRPDLQVVVAGRDLIRSPSGNASESYARIHQAEKSTQNTAVHERSNEHHVAAGRGAQALDLRPDRAHAFRSQPSRSRNFRAMLPQSVLASWARVRRMPSGCSSSYRAQAMRSSLRPSIAFESRAWRAAGSLQSASFSRTSTRFL